MSCAQWSILALGLLSGCVQAEPQGSRLLATGAGSSFEGSAGGGIVPMAVLSGYASREEVGGTAFVTHVSTDDYDLSLVGASWNWRNRVELSVAEQRLSHQKLSNALGVEPDSIRQMVLGAKVRLVGDLIYTPWPQISLGAQHKRNRDFFVPRAAGAQDDSGTDVYLAASKLMLGALAGRNLLLNVNLRATRANQTGLVGFGGDRNDDHELMTELSAGLFLNRHWLIGGEYRQKPNNLSFARENDWYTGFVGWFPNKRWSLVAAYVDLGDIASLTNQRGWYLSLEGSF